MIRAARAYFLTRALREKLLLLAFVGIGAIWWLSAYSTRAATFWRSQRSVAVRLDEQDMWIKNQARIEETARANAAKLDPTKTLNGLQLVTAIQQLASEAGLKGARSTGNTQTRESGQLAIHSVDYQIPNVEWGPLLKFYGALQNRSPYIALESMTLSAAQGRESQLTLVLKASSVEIRR